MVQPGPGPPRIQEQLTAMYITHPDHVLKTAIRACNDPALLVDLVERLFRSDPQDLPVPERARPQASWCLAAQGKRVHLAAWAAEFCDDPETMRLIWAQPRLRVGIQSALWRNTALPAELRAAMTVELPEATRNARPTRHKIGQSGSWSQRWRYNGDLNRLTGQTDERWKAVCGCRSEFATPTSPADLLAQLEMILEDAQDPHGYRPAALLTLSEDHLRGAGRVVLDRLFAHFDWGWDRAQTYLDAAACSALGVPARTVEPAPESSLRTPAPEALASTMLHLDLPMTDQELASIVICSLPREIQTKNGPVSEVKLSGVATREQLAVALAVLTPRRTSSRSHPLASLEPQVADLFTSDNDPLVIRAVELCRPKAALAYLTGRWKRGVRTAAPWMAGSSVRFTGRILPTEEGIRAAIALGHSDVSASTIAGALTWAEQPTTHVPLAIIAVALEHLPLPYEDNGMAAHIRWDALMAATSDVDLALSMAADHTTVPLRELCATIHNMDHLLHNPKKMAIVT